MIILARPCDEDLHDSEPPFDWLAPPPSGDRRDLLTFANGVYSTLVAVDAATTLFAEARPLVAVSLRVRADDSLLFDTERTLYYETAVAALSPKPLDFSPVWLMVDWLLGAGGHTLEQLALVLPAPGASSYASLVLASRLKLEHSDLAWLGVLRRRHSHVSWRALVQLYGLVDANVLSLRCDQTTRVYGVALYERAASLAHACVPTARVHIERGGALRVVAARALAPNSALTLNRHLTVSPVLTTIQLAPARLRNAAHHSSGRACRCHACVRALVHLRSTIVSRHDALDATSAQRMVDSVEVLWTTGVVDEAARLLKRADGVTMPFDVFTLDDSSTAFLRERLDNDAFARLIATERWRSPLPVELSRALCSLAIGDPLQALHNHGAAVLFGAADYLASERARTTVAATLARQAAAADVVDTRLRDYDAQAMALAYGTRTIVGLIVRDDAAPIERSGELLVRLERALEAFIGLGDADTPARRTAMTRVYRSLTRPHALYASALRATVASAQL